MSLSIESYKLIVLLVLFFVSSCGPVKNGEYTITGERLYKRDLTAPRITSLSPSHQATAVEIDQNLVVTFDDDISYNSAINSATTTISIKLASDDSTVFSYSISDNEISLGTKTLTINPASDLSYSTQYYVEVASSLVGNARNLVFSGILADAWSFTTRAPPPPGITVSAINRDTTEWGTSATFSIVLDAEPSANVQIYLDSSDPLEGIPNQGSVVFTNADWNIPQIVTVLADDDAIDDDDKAYTIILQPAVSADLSYHGIDGADVNLFNLDDDTAGVTVTSIDATTSEAGAAGEFSIVLNSEPTDDVVIALASSDVTEGTVASASVTFNSVTWNTAQTISVSGINDVVDDGDINYSITTAAAVSTDTKYNGMNASDLTFTNADNDSAGVTVTSIDATTSEAGAVGEFSLVLNSQPTANVVIALSSSDETEGTLGTSSLTFTTADWNTAQTVSVSGVDDDIDDGDVSYSIVTAAAVSADANYNGINPNNISLTNSDDDTAGFTVTSIDTTTSEAGASGSFTLVLDSEPTADVTISLASSNSSEGSVSAGTSDFVFNSTNWDTAVTVTVIGEDDLIADGNQSYNVGFSSLTSGDNIYAMMASPTVNFLNIDNDSVDTTSPTVTINQAGSQADPTADLPISFTVVFSEPISTATFGIDDFTQLGTATNLDIEIVNSGNDTNFTVNVVSLDAAGTVRLQIDANSLEDLSGNLNLVSTSVDQTVTYNPGQRTIYLATTDCDNNAAEINDNSIPFCTAQAAVDKAIAASPSGGNSIVIDVGTGNFGDVVLNADFGALVYWTGSGYGQSFIGNIIAVGTQGANGTDAVDNNDGMACLGATPATAGGSGGTGYTIHLTGLDGTVEFGDIISNGGNGGNGGNGFTGSIYCGDQAPGDGGNGGNAGIIVLTRVKAANVSAVGGSYGNYGNNGPAGTYYTGTGGESNYVSLTDSLASNISTYGQGCQMQSFNANCYGDPKAGGNITLATSTVLNSCNASAGTNNGQTNCVSGGNLMIDGVSNCGSFSSTGVSSVMSCSGYEGYFNGAICNSTSSLSASWSITPVLNNSTFSYNSGGSGYMNFQVDSGNFTVPWFYSTTVTWNSGGGSGTLTATMTDVKCTNIAPFISIVPYE